MHWSSLRDERDSSSNMPQKHVSEGSGPEWKTAESDGKELPAVSGEGYKTNNVDSTVDMEIAIGEQDS